MLETIEPMQIPIARLMTPTAILLLSSAPVVKGMRAAMATAKMVFGSIPGVDRPALAAVFPTAVSTVAILLDVGANVDCKPENLEQFAVMGEIYFRSMFGTRRPRVGLLSIGEEESKGNELTREAFQLLKRLPLA